jgi:hypothetical protein
LIRETTENESANEGYRFGQEEETYNIVAAHGYFGRLIFHRYLSIYISSTLQISLKLLSPLNFSIIIPFPIFLFPPNLFTEAKNTIPNPNPDHPSFLSGFKI